MRKRYLFIVSIAAFLFISLNDSERNTLNNNGWISLFDGYSLPPFHHYLGRPDSSINVPGLKRDSSGNYIESLGWNDPLKVFSITTLDNEPVIRISGQVIGGLVLADSLADYHLKLKFRWGSIKWGWMKGRPNDGGILYHSANGVRHEFQIQEGDIGSYWSRNIIADIPCKLSTDIPSSIQQLRPYIQREVHSLHDTMLIFNQKAGLHHFSGDKDWQIVLAHPCKENSFGGWNTMELICYKNHSVHIVNGKVNMIVLNAKVKNNNSIIPLCYGKLILQSGGSEIFFKDIFVKEIKEMPVVLKNFLHN